MEAFEIATSGGEKIKVGVKKYRGHDVLDVRKWYLDDTGQRWFPTQRGITLSVSRWKEIMPEMVRLLAPTGETTVVESDAQATVSTRSRSKKAGKK